MKKEKNGLSATRIIIFSILSWTLLVIFLPEAWVVESIKKEDSLISEYLPKETSKAIQNGGWNLYHFFFEKSGINNFVNEILFPPENLVNNAKDPLAEIGSGTWFVFMKSLSNKTYLILRQFFVRVYNSFVWTPYVILIATFAIRDGIIRRKIRRYSMDPPSSLIQTVSYLIISASGYIFLGLLFAPFPVHPLTTAFIGTLVSIVFGVSFLANLPKKL